MSTPQPRILVIGNIEAYYHHVARLWIYQCGEAIKARGVCRIVLAGGNTPKRLYEQLADASYKSQLDWKKVKFFFSDERCVPLDHPDSNYRMVHQALLQHIPGCTVYPMVQDAAQPQADARRYAELLREELNVDGDDKRRFDLTLLGMGEDGHTASLFPGTDILDDPGLAAAVFVPAKNSWRISLCYSALELSRHTMLLVNGAGKAETLQRVFHSQPGPDAELLPVQRLRTEGRVEWCLDKAAASLIKPELLEYF